MVVLCPFSTCKVAPKGGKSTDRDQNQIISGGDQDTTAHQISDHSFHVFSIKYRQVSNISRT